MSNTDTFDYVIVSEQPLRGELAPSYLTKQGRSLDPAIRAAGLRDWAPILATDMVEVFSDARTAHNAALTYGGRVQHVEDAEQIEIGRGGIVRLTDGQAPHQDMGL